MKLAFAILGWIISLYAQPVISVTGPSGNQRAGNTITLAVTLSSTGTAADQAVQFSVSGIPWPVTVSVGSAASAASKNAYCFTAASVVKCIIAGLNTSILADGFLAIVTVPIPKTAQAGTIPITISNLLAASNDSNGNANAAPLVAASPFSLSTISACDLNSDGVIDSLDHLLAVDQANGKTACTSGDLDSNGKCDVVDVQIIGNAVVSHVCGAR